jgi:hypothetical protein
MNEVTLEKNDGFVAMKQLIERFLIALIGLDISLLAAPAGEREKFAAE